MLNLSADQYAVKIIIVLSVNFSQNPDLFQIKPVVSPSAAGDWACV